MISCSIMAMCFALWRKLTAKDGQAWGFVLCTLILAVQPIRVLLWR
jgi:hypothetical protein